MRGAPMTSSAGSSSGGQTAVDAARIRGRRNTPGLRCQGPVEAENGQMDPRSSSPGAAAREEVIDVPTLGSSVSTVGLVESKLDAANRKIAGKNASIAISLADHEERVAKKKARGADVGATPQTAAERMAALRRRIAERRRTGTMADRAEDDEARGGQGPAAGADDGGHESVASCCNGDVLEASDAPASNEDEKMHLDMSDFDGTAATLVGEEVEADVCGMAGTAAAASGGGGRDNAAASAAAAWAQHALPLGDEDDGSCHLKTG